MKTMVCLYLGHCVSLTCAWVLGLLWVMVAVLWGLRGWLVVVVEVVGVVAEGGCEGLRRRV